MPVLYSPVILGDLYFNVTPLPEDRPTGDSPFLIRINAKFTRPSLSDQNSNSDSDSDSDSDSESDSESESHSGSDSEEEEEESASFSMALSLPTTALAEATAARGAVSELLSSVLISPSVMHSRVVDSIVSAISGGRTIGVVVTIDLYVDRLPELDGDGNDGEIKGIERVRTEEAVTCSICWEDVKVGSESARLPCRHCYHEVCIIKWLVKNMSCPLCRFQLT